MDRKTYLNGGERDGMHQAGSVLGGEILQEASPSKVSFGEKCNVTCCQTEINQTGCMRGGRSWRMDVDERLTRAEGAV